MRPSRAMSHGMSMQPSAGAATIGDHLRLWRKRRRLSQLALALDAEISQKHLSFIESGRARPSRAMVLRLAERLDAPLRERNLMLAAAGHAPAWRERGLEDPALATARAAIDMVLTGHEPFPALAVDGLWRLVAANRAVAPLLALAQDAALLEPPVNVLRLSLHPKGLAPRIRNLGEWRAHVLARLSRQVEATGESGLARLLHELAGYGGAAGDHDATGFAGVLTPLRLATEAGELSFFSTTTVFGAPGDITLAEIAIEAFFPADAATGAALRAIADAGA